MRISDWSSDVCSSDLTDIGFFGLCAVADESICWIILSQHCHRDGGIERRQGLLIDVRRDGGLVPRLKGIGRERPKLRQNAVDCDSVLEIGRAPCRERVGQYL